MLFHVGIPMSHICYKNIWLGFQFGPMSYVLNLSFGAIWHKCQGLWWTMANQFFFTQYGSSFIYSWINIFTWITYLTLFIGVVILGFLEKWSFNKRLNGTILLALARWELLCLIVFQPNILNTFQHTQSWCQIQQILIEVLCVGKFGKFLLICLKFENNHALTLLDNENIYTTLFVHSWPQTLVTFFLVFGYCQKKLRSLY